MNESQLDDWFKGLQTLELEELEERVETLVNLIAASRAELDVLNLLVKHITEREKHSESEEEEIANAIDRVNGREGQIIHNSKHLVDPLAWLDEPSGGEIWRHRHSDPSHQKNGKS